MKARYKFWIQRSFYFYTLFFLLCFFCILLAFLCFEHRQLDLFYKNIGEYKFQDNTLKYKSINIKLPEQNYYLMSYFNNIETKGYIYLLHSKIEDNLIEGYLVFNKEFHYLDFKLTFWENHSEWVSLINNGEFHQQMIESMKIKYPFLDYSELDFGGNISFLKDGLFKQNLNILQENISIIINNLNNVILSWEKSKQLNMAQK